MVRIVILGLGFLMGFGAGSGFGRNGDLTEGQEEKQHERGGGNQMMSGYACGEVSTSRMSGGNQASPFVVILGIAQDAGYPQVNCQKACCEKHWAGEEPARRVACIGLVDPDAEQCWLFDATPDFTAQVMTLQSEAVSGGAALAGVFLTHAHIGHYTGLMYLGREAMGAQMMPVYVMPRMASFLNEHGPWSQLVKLQNISLTPMQADDGVEVGAGYRIEVKPFLVPHRDEFSETVGFRIEGPEKSLVYIPDIDKWERWERDLKAVVRESDYVLIDGTFFENGELPGRDMSEIPHPFVVESMALLKELPVADREKVVFIHFNHTNPLLMDGVEKERVEEAGFRVGRSGMRFVL